MTGRYEIELYNNRVHYSLAVERNITIIQGESATGKTELIRLLSAYINNGISSGITLICERDCIVLENAMWEKQIADARQCIIFADEGSSFLKSREFAVSVRESDNYFVLITREDLPQLPYSITEIYGMHLDEKNKYHDAKRIYNELYRLYHLNRMSDSETNLIITEDSNSGNEFYTEISNVPVHSAFGKSNVLSEIDKNFDRHILTIVDGAAFGSEIGRLMRYLNDTGSDTVIYAPESFEYLLLKADIVDHTSRVTKETYLYADSCMYMSWEEFYTAYLRQEVQKTIYHYSKSKLNRVYLTQGNLKKILAQLPEYMMNIIKSTVQAEANDLEDGESGHQ